MAGCALKFGAGLLTKGWRRRKGMCFARLHIFPSFHSRMLCGFKCLLFEGILMLIMVKKGRKGEKVFE
jgi:hypothetical protein